MDNKISPIGTNWSDYRKTRFTLEEIEQTNLKVALVGEIIKARHAQGLTQKELEQLCGVRQPIIARMEKGTTDPQLSTVMKVLHSLGKTLEIVDIEHHI